MCYKKTGLLYSPSLGELTRHHRLPRSIGGKHEGENISFVPDKLHSAYHLLFVNGNAKRVADILNEHWIDPAYHILAIPIEDLARVQEALCMKNLY